MSNSTVHISEWKRHFYATFFSGVLGQRNYFKIDLVKVDLVKVDLVTSEFLLEKTNKNYAEGQPFENIVNYSQDFGWAGDC